MLSSGNLVRSVTKAAPYAHRSFGHDHLGRSNQADRCRRALDAVHVDWPSNARGDAAQFAGYLVEVVVSIDQAGRWKNTRANTFIAG